MASAEPPDLEIESLQDIEDKEKNKKKFDIEEFFVKFRYPLVFLLAGLTLVGFGVILFKNTNLGESSKIEVLESAGESQNQSSEIVVEVSGALQKPGVYKLPSGARVEDLLIAAGGISVDADRVWMEKYLNRAGKLSDGQKIFIPKEGEGSTGVKSSTPYSSSATGQASSGVTSEELININTASQKQLEDLPGIGPVYAQSIIEHRPYSSVEELLSKGALKNNVYEKIKNLVSVY